jgi:hypothetical protein
MREPWHPLDKTIYDTIKIEYPVESIVDAITAAETVAVNYRDDILFDGIKIQTEYSFEMPRKITCLYSVPYVNKDKPNGRVRIQIDVLKSVIEMINITYDDQKENPFESIQYINMENLSKELIDIAKSDENAFDTSEISIIINIKTMSAEIEIISPSNVTADGTYFDAAIIQIIYDLKYRGGQYELDTDCITRIWQSRSTQG